MIKKIGLLIFNLFTIATVFAQKEKFAISIVQDSVCMPDAEHNVWLQKKPFKIQVTLQDLDGVYLFAFFTDSIFKIQDKDVIPGFKDIASMAMAEESFNPSKELIVNDEGWSYWFYMPKQDWHRFDSGVQVSGKIAVGNKSVQQFYLMPSEKTLPVTEVIAPLYLFFFSAKDNKKQDLVKELQRYKLKINWL